MESLENFINTNFSQNRSVLFCASFLADRSPFLAPPICQPMKKCHFSTLLTPSVLQLGPGASYFYTLNFFVRRFLAVKSATFLIPVLINHCVQIFSLRYSATLMFLLYLSTNFSLVLTLTLLSTEPGQKSVVV